MSPKATPKKDLVWGSKTLYVAPNLQENFYSIQIAIVSKTSVEWDNKRFLNILYTVHTELYN